MPTLPRPFPAATNCGACTCEGSEEANAPPPSLPMCAVQVRYVREGSEEAELFSQLLLDEPDLIVSHDDSTSSGAPPAAASEEAGAPASFGLAQFLDHVRGEVGLHLTAAAAE